MFERYTETARQLIFVARHEASQVGAPFIEPEHFLLALLQQKNSLLRRLLFPNTLDLIEKDVRETLASNPSSQLQVDLPLSHSMKRVLAYGAEASEVLSDPIICSEHLLLGLLKETDCLATRILEKHGVYERVFEQLALIGPSTIDRPHSKPTHETLNALIAALPAGALEHAYAALTHLQVWPRRPATPARVGELQKEMEECFKSSIRPGMTDVRVSGGSWNIDSRDRLRDGSYCSGRVEDGVRVTETHRFFRGHEITIVERLRATEDGKTLSYSQEIHGPKRDHSIEIDFDIS